MAYTTMQVLITTDPDEADIFGHLVTDPAKSTLPVTVVTDPVQADARLIYVEAEDADEFILVVV